MAIITPSVLYSDSTSKEFDNLFLYNEGIDDLIGHGLPVIAGHHINNAGRSLVHSVEFLFNISSLVTYYSGYNNTPIIPALNAPDIGGASMISIPQRFWQTKSSFSAALNQLSDGQISNAHRSHLKTLLFESAKVKFATLLDDLFLPVTVRDPFSTTLNSKSLFVPYKINSTVPANQRFFDWRGFGKTFVRNTANLSTLYFTIKDQISDFNHESNNRNQKPIFFVDQYTFNNISNAFAISNDVAKVRTNIDNTRLQQMMTENMVFPWSEYDQFILCKVPVSTQSNSMVLTTSAVNGGVTLEPNSDPLGPTQTNISRFLKPCTISGELIGTNNDPILGPGADGNTVGGTPTALVNAAGQAPVLGSAFVPSSVSMSLSDTLILNFWTTGVAKSIAGNMAPLNAIYMGINGGRTILGDNFIISPAETVTIFSNEVRSRDPNQPTIVHEVNGYSATRTIRNIGAQRILLDDPTL
jgi:hypothetical protein